jgi:hypothetical protein
MDSSDSNESLGPIKLRGVGFLDQLSDYHPLSKDPSLWRQ